MVSKRRNAFEALLIEADGSCPLAVEHGYPALDYFEEEWDDRLDPETSLTPIRAASLRQLARRALQRNPNIRDRFSPSDQFVLAIWQIRRVNQQYRDTPQWPVTAASIVDALGEAVGAHNVKWQLKMMELAFTHLIHFESSAAEHDEVHTRRKIVGGAKKGGKNKSARWDPLRQWCRALFALRYAAAPHLSLNAHATAICAIVSHEFARQIKLEQSNALQRTAFSQEGDPTQCATDLPYDPQLEQAVSAVRENNVPPPVVKTLTNWFSEKPRK